MAGFADSHESSSFLATHFGEEASFRLLRGFNVVILLNVSLWSFMQLCTVGTKE